MKKGNWFLITYTFILVFCCSNFFFKKRKSKLRRNSSKDGEGLVLKKFITIIWKLYCFRCHHIEVLVLIPLARRSLVWVKNLLSDSTKLDEEGRNIQRKKVLLVDNYGGDGGNCLVVRWKSNGYMWRSNGA